MNNLGFKHILAIGDWSDDGHGKSDLFAFRCSHDECAVKTGYANAVIKSGVSFHDHHRNAIKGDRFSAKFKPKWNNVCNDCDDPYITLPIKEALESIGVDFKKLDLELEDADEEDSPTWRVYPQQIAELIMEMAGTQIPGFNYAKEGLGTLNGFWSDDFNVNFGYGCYDNSMD